MTPFAQNLQAAGWLGLTMMLFAVSDALLKVVFQRLPVGEVAFVRGIFVCGCLLLFQAVPGRLPPLRACLNRVSLLRGLVELGTALSFFMGLSRLPLATTTTLTFASPIIMTALATIVLREPVGWRRWCAVLAGFIGVVIVVRPAPSSFEPAVLWPLLTACLVATRDLMTRFVPSHIDASAMALTTATVVMLGGAVIAPFDWLPPTSGELWLMLIGAVLIATAYTSIVHAFRLGDISFIAPFRYVSIPLSVLLGWLLFGDIPGWNVYLGAAVIAGSGLFIFTRERIRARQKAAKESGA